MIETDSLRQPFEVDDLDTDGVLRELDHAEIEDRVAARRKFRLVCQWARLHPAEEGFGATWGDGERGPGAECDDPIGGEGSPLVAAEAVPRLGAAMGIALATALAWTADTIDVVHRLGRTHARVEALEVPVWKARKVASMTRSLSATAAAWVDEQLAHRLHEVGFVTVGRIIDAAVAIFHADRIQPPDESDRAQWRVGFYRPAGMSGASICLDVTGDTLDLTALHDLVCRVAEALRLDGDLDVLEQRKARAFGLIGRGEHDDLLARTSKTRRSPDHRAEGGVAEIRRHWQPRRPGSPTKIYVHLLAADLAVASCASVSGAKSKLRVGHAEGHGPVTIERIREWAARPGVRIQPVQDGRHQRCGLPRSTDWMADLVRLRDPHCVFPGCQHGSRTCDLDHIKPYRPNGPPGQTHAGNLPPLCRGHHNAKTHQRWRYRRLPDGTYRWTSVDGTQYLVYTAGSIIVPGT